MSATAEWTTRLPGTLRSASLGVTDGCVHCSVVQSKQRSVLAYSLVGEMLWAFPYPPHQHDFILGAGKRIYLDGQRVLCLSPADGLVTASRDFPIALTQTAPAESGPVFFLGDPIDAVGYIGLHPETLATVWEWPELLAQIRGAWIQGKPQSGIAKFVRLADLSEHELSVGELPAARGRQVCWAALAGTWCQFGGTAAAALSLPSGELAWRRDEKEEGHHRILWSDHDSAYAGITSLSAYDLATGLLRWRHECPGVLGNHSAHTEDIGYVVVNKRSVLRIQLADGEIASRFDTDAEILDLIAVDRHRAIVGTAGRLVCVRFP